MPLQSPTVRASRRPRRRGPAALALSALLLVAACSGNGSPSAGQALPATDLESLDSGTPTSFDAYRGKPLVVNLWASWCTPCRTEMPAFEQVHQQVGDRVTIVGLTDDPNRDAAREAAAATRVTYPLLVDTGGRFQSDLGIVGLPSTVFVDTSGKVLATHSGVLDETSLLEEIGRLYGQS